MEKHKCVGYNKPKGMVGILHSAHYKDHYKCDSNATLFEDDKWYCKRHAPSKKKEREDKKWQTELNRINRCLAKNPLPK